MQPHTYIELQTYCAYENNIQINLQCDAECWTLLLSNFSSASCYAPKISTITFFIRCTHPFVWAIKKNNWKKDGCVPEIPVIFRRGYSLYLWALLFLLLYSRRQKGSNADSSAHWIYMTDGLGNHAVYRINNCDSRHNRSRGRSPRLSNATFVNCFDVHSFLCAVYLGESS